MSYSLGIDLGTSGVKIVLVTIEGEIVKEVSKIHPIYYPQSGWAEQHPEDWWYSVKEGIKEILTDVESSQVTGIGVSGQMHGLVLIDKHGDPLLPCILWNDQRSYKETEYLNHKIGKDRLIELTGNIAFPGFTAPKVLWIQNNHPNLFKKTKYICLPKDYINYKLTGQFFTDVSDASGTLYFDVKNRKWSEEMMEILRINKDMLPKVYESYEVVGRTGNSLSKELNIPICTPVVAGAGDNAAAAVGANVIEEGTIMISLGTSGVVFTPQSKYSSDHHARLHTFCDGNKQWHTMGVILSAASSLKWWVEEIQKESYDTLLEEAIQSPVGSKGLFFLPYLSGERTPYNDPYAKGTFIGLSHRHSRGDMTRAVLEGITFALNDAFKAALELSVPIDKVRALGGGSKSDLWLHIIADVFGKPVEHCISTGGPALGAALLVLRGGEIKNNDENFKNIVPINKVVNPDRKKHQDYQIYYNQFKKLYKHLQKAFKEISTLIQ